MHNKVVFRVAQALGDLNVPTLRFNYRGVGRSTGAYDKGRGEGDDIRTALDALAERFPGTPLCLAGFSFGSWLGLPIGCADPRVTHLVGVGVPAKTLTVSELPGCKKPKLIVQGDQDQYGPPAELRAWFDRIPEPKALALVPGADHFFATRQQQLYEAVQEYFAGELE
jgi:alpha/beta superfamily hydrolase